MKKLLSIGFAAAVSISAFAQTAVATSAVPQQVVEGFRTQYPNVSNVTWTEEAGYYQPNFTVSGAQTIGYIDLKGHLIQTIVKVGATGLPAAAATYITSNYAGAQVSEAGRIDFPNGLDSRFYAKVSGKQLLFDLKGNFIKVTASPLKQ
ncbi:MAG: hypothetical protein JWO03_2527 [Bacteroidetes bacterium]|nr:hypothetical protein [Bacteroidota bacterium]